MSLIEQQAALKRAVVAGEEAAGIEGRLGIYQHAYTARLTGALRDNFGVVPRVLGDDAFDALALAYIEAHPSTHPSIRWFGNRLPEFMAERDDLVPHPAIVDLAAMEWKLRCAFDAADAQALDADELKLLPAQAWPALVLRPMPGLCLLPLQWNVGPVWRALQGEEEVDLPEPEPMVHSLLIWRQGLMPRWRTLDGVALGLLSDAIAGKSFGELCARSADGVSTDEAALTAASALRGWIDDGLFRRDRQISCRSQ